MLHVTKIAALCELVLNPEILHLELADGSKVQSTQKATNVNVCVGKSICRVDFTVTKLLKDVDLVLGVNWLSVWNPVINWKEQMMHIWTEKEWSEIQGILLHSNNIIGTVKDFVYYDVDSREKIPDFIVMRKPQFWMYNTACTKSEKRAGSNEGQNCIIETLSNSENSLQAAKVEKKNCKQQFQLISAKTLQKCIHREESVFLAFVRPTNPQHEQGMTQRVKREQMKYKGPVRKAPPVAENKFVQKHQQGFKKNYISYWKSSRIYFLNNSRRADLLNVRWSLKLKPRKGLFLQTNPLIASVLKSMRNYKLKLTIYLLKDTSALLRAPTEPLFFLSQRKMNAGACVSIIKH